MTFDYAALEMRAVLEYLSMNKKAPLGYVNLSALNRAERRALKVTCQTRALADLATIDEDESEPYVLVPRDALKKALRARKPKPDRTKQRDRQREHARKR